MSIKALAIVDAGIGGLGTYQAIKARSNIPVMYFSDSGYEPYGVVPTVRLRNRLKLIFAFLYTQGAERIAVACNAASCALPDDSNVEGIIRHGITAIGQSGIQDIGLIGGARTIRSQVYARSLRATGINLQQRIAQALSIRVEAGDTSSDALQQETNRIMAPLYNSGAILLACTHYPAISKVIQAAVSPDTRLIDPAEHFASWIIENWKFDESDVTDYWFTTGDPAKLITNGQRAFGVNIPKVRQVTL